MVNFFQRLLKDYRKDILMWFVFISIALAFFAIEYKSVIIYDDWVQLIKDQPFPIIGKRNRPLWYLAARIESELFGFSITKYYFFEIFLLGCSAFLLFQIAYQFQRTKYRGITSFFIGVFLILYPIFSKYWLSAISGTWLFSALLPSFLIFQYYQKEKMVFLISATLTACISLFIYESGLGLFLMMGLLVFFGLLQKAKPKQAFKMIVFFLGIALYLIWRFFIIGGALGRAHKSSDGTLFGLFLQKFFSAGKTTALSFLIGVDHYLNIDPSLTANLLAGFVALIMVAGGLMRRKTQPDGMLKKKNQEVRNESFIIFFIGILLFIAGLFPIILASTFSIKDIPNARYLLPSSIGMSIALVGGIRLLCSGLFFYPKIFHVVFSIFCILNLTLAGCALLAARQEFNYGWQIQKTIWQDMRAIAPAFQDGTTIVIHIPKTEMGTTFNILPLTYNWEARAAVQKLYENPSLDAMVWIGDSRTEYRADGIFHYGSMLHEWNSAIIFLYDFNLQQLELITDQPNRIELVQIPAGYQPVSHITEKENPQFPYPKFELVQESN